MTHPRFNSQERSTLLEIARTSISHGLVRHQSLDVNPGRFSGLLIEPRACFVTLRLDGQLRGCIGRLEPDGPLVCSVSRNAYAAAFQDPRFRPVSDLESRELSIHISVLSIPEPMTFRDEEDLLNQLDPGVDGLVLETGRCRGTFLPAVWESLPEPKDFLSQLKVKAGLHPDAWPSDVQVKRYTCESVE